MLTNSIDFSASWWSAALAVSEARSPNSLLLAADPTIATCSSGITGSTTLPKQSVVVLMEPLIGILVVVLTVSIGSIAGRSREEREETRDVRERAEASSDTLFGLMERFARFVTQKFAVRSVPLRDRVRDRAVRA